MMEGSFGDLVNPVIESHVSQTNPTAYFEIWRDFNDEDNWGCVENNVGVWKRSNDISVVGNAIAAFIVDNFDLSGNTSIRFDGGSDHQNPPSDWETL